MRANFIIFIVIFLLFSVNAQSVAKENDCRDACYRTYGKDKAQYENCVRQKCGAAEISQPAQESGKETKKLIIEPKKKLASGKTAHINVENKNVRIKETKKGTIIKESSSNSISAKADILINYENGKLVSGKSKKQIKVLPSDIKQKVAGIKNITLVDEGSPKYLVKSKSKGKLFGAIPVNINRDYEINAETGDTLRINAPWWSNLVREIEISIPKEGESCNLIGDRACDEGLRCEPKAGTKGVCRLFPPAFHGRIVYEWDSWDDFESWFNEHWPEVPLPEARSFAYETDEGIEVSFVKWLEWFERANRPYKMRALFIPSVWDEDSLEINSYFADERGNFRGAYLQSSKYKIVTQLLGPGQISSPEVWSFSINDGPDLTELNLCGSAYNDYNKIRMVEDTRALMAAPALPVPGQEVNICDE